MAPRYRGPTPISPRGRGSSQVSRLSVGRGFEPRPTLEGLVKAILADSRRGHAPGFTGALPACGGVPIAAYTGLRAEEVAGLEVGDLVFSSTRAHINVHRAKKRRAGEWVADTLKSAKSRRTVPLPGWLAERMRESLAQTHPCADEPIAPLWPNRALGGVRRRGCRAVAPLEFSEPVDPGAYYKNLLRPALEDVGLPANRPVTKDAPAVRGVRMHDLRHPFVHAPTLFGRSLYAGVKVARAQHVHPHAGCVRRLHPRGRRRCGQPSTRTNHLGEASRDAGQRCEFVWAAVC